MAAIGQMPFGGHHVSENAFTDFIRVHAFVARRIDRGDGEVVGRPYGQPCHGIGHCAGRHSDGWRSVNARRRGYINLV